MTPEEKADLLANPISIQAAIDLGREVPELRLHSPGYWDRVATETKRRLAGDTE